MTLPLIDHPDWQSPLAQAELRELANASNILGGGSVLLWGVDMRNYASIITVITARGPNPATAYNPVDVLSFWTADSAASVPIFNETFSFFSQPAGGAVFLTPGGRLVYIDGCRGPYYNLSIGNRGPNTVAMTATVYGSSQVTPARLVRESDVSTVSANTDSLSLVDSGGVVTLGAGATRTYISRLHLGRVWMRLSAGTTQHTFTFFDTFGLQFESIVVQPAGIVRVEMPWVERAVRVTVTNDGAVNGDHRINIHGLKETQ